MSEENEAKAPVQKVEELEAPVQELGPEEAEAVAGGLQLNLSSGDDDSPTYAFKQGFPIKWSG